MKRYYKYKDKPHIFEENRTIETRQWIGVLMIFITISGLMILAIWIWENVH